MTAKEIINSWIKYAGKNKLSPHSKHFWNARDIIEGTIKFSDIKIRETISFIKTLDDSESRKIILNELSKSLEVA